MSLIRMYQSAVDPADIEAVRRLFADDVKPAFADTPGCEGIELLVGCDENAGGLVAGMAVSRWVDRASMDAALESRAVREALVRILELLRQEPVTRVFEVTA